MGQATVGAMIVWNEDLGSFDKKSFRHYNLESKDEYSQMREMLIRRVESFSKNPAPDLWIIDGGETLLKLAFDIVQSIGVNLDIIAISKQKFVDWASHSRWESSYADKREGVAWRATPSQGRLWGEVQRATAKL